MAPPEALTPQRRQVAAALLFLGSAALAGMLPGEGGVDYRTFGVVEGVLALLLTYILLLRRVWLPLAGPLGWVAVGYGALATAQCLELLLPPPGIIEWVVVFALSFTLWGALGGGTRRRVVAVLASLALLLALVKFSVVPVLWERAGPAPGEAFGLGSLAEGVRRLFVDYRPVGPLGELVGFASLALWALGTRLLWDREG